jgi:hypothetical protein
MPVQTLVNKRVTLVSVAESLRSHTGTCGGDAGEPPRQAAMIGTLVQVAESLRNPAIMTLARL